MYMIKVTNRLGEILILKRVELSELVELLCTKQQELEDLTVEIAIFESRYQHELGSKFILLDELNAKISQFRAEKEPDNLNLELQARLSRDLYLESKAEREQYLNPTSDKTPIPFKPSAELKKLYRALIKAIHPDLTLDEQEKIPRTLMMIEVNKAYQEQNMLKLRSMWFDLISQGKIAYDEDLPLEEQLEEVEETIKQVKQRIKEISIEIIQLKEQPLYQLMENYLTAREEENRDLLAEMSAQIDMQIQEAQTFLQELEREMDYE